MAVGDFNNDGFDDLAVITRSSVSLYVNHHGKFESLPAKLPEGSFTKAVWIDYDHDYDLDLLLLGKESVLLRNDGPAGFSDQSSRFPFVAGRAVDAATFELIPDNTETDVAVEYDDGRLVINPKSYEPRSTLNAWIDIKDVPLQDWARAMVDERHAAHERSEDPALSFEMGCAAALRWLANERSRAAATDR